MWEDANCYPAFPPSLSLAPLLPYIRLSSVCHGHFYTLIFCKLYLIALLFLGTWRKTSYSHWLTHTHTRHITIWLPDLPLGPKQPNHSSAGRTAMTMQNGWTKRKGEGWKPCAFSTATFVDSEREDGLFVNQHRKKWEGENCLMPYNKVTNLSCSSLSPGDLSSPDVYSISQCSVWEVPEGVVHSVLTSFL